MRKEEMSRAFRGSRGRGGLIQRHRRSAIGSKWTPQIDWASIQPRRVIAAGGFASLGLGCGLGRRSVRESRAG